MCFCSLCEHFDFGYINRLFCTFGVGVWYIRSSQSHLSHVLCIILQLHNWPVNWARKLFKLLKMWWVLICIKKLKCFGSQVLLGWRRKWGRFKHFWPWSSCPGPQPQKPIFWLKFSLETRLMWVLGAFGCLSSVSDSKVMSQKPFFGKKIIF